MIAYTDEQTVVFIFRTPTCTWANVILEYDMNFLLNEATH